MNEGPLDTNALTAKTGTIDMENRDQVESYITELENAVLQLQNAQHQDLAYGPGLPAAKTVMPDEKQLHFVYDTQPKKDDIEKSEDWDSFTFDETEILRQIQFGMFTQPERESLLREYADVQVLRQQQGKGRVAINAMKRLHLRILSSKSLLEQGREPALVLLHQPTNKTVYEQKIPAQPQKPTGFLAALGLRK